MCKLFYIGKVRETSIPSENALTFYIAFKEDFTVIDDQMFLVLDYSSYSECARAKYTFPDKAKLVHLLIFF